MLKRALILVLPLLACCRTARQVKPVQASAPTLPAVRQRVEPVTSAVSSQLSEINLDDPIQLTIFQARYRFNEGEKHYRQGALKKAKEQFDSAVDLILETTAIHPQEPRLQRELVDLVSRVNAMELAALREGEGFTDQSDQPAAIDDLESVETFPALIDPKLKKSVEDEVQAIAHDLPIEINDRVLGFLNYYQNGRGRNFIELGLERAGRYQPMI